MSLLLLLRSSSAPTTVAGAPRVRVAGAWDKTKKAQVKVTGAWTPADAQVRSAGAWTAP